MLTDFANLNKACTNDYYPLPYLGRLVNIERNMEIYIDDMLVKSRRADDHLGNLRKTREVLRLSRLRINPQKCSFGVTSEKFLGYMIKLPSDELEAKKVVNRSYRFQMIQEEMYKQSHLGHLLFCVPDTNIDQTLYEVHEGHVRGHYIGGALFGLEDNRSKLIPLHPVAEMSPVVCPIPFTMWGIDLVGEFLKPPVKYKMLWSWWTTSVNGSRLPPFSLVSGTKGVLPIEVCLPSIRVIGPGTYKLEELSGNPIDHTWHEIYLKKYYV
ncbi:hypothetical protein LIER_25470 [Lithospermum erythrorhizon]|uniref:Reverse transcriptase domain-containing protein n=1 Tax=Lithospermum erythrorhizon TaxID=34254 RepID=A0AAV3R4V2_LITER